MSRWIDPSSPVFAGLLVFLVVAALKTSMVLTLAGLSAWVCRRSSASTRHLVWGLAFVGCFILPALTATLPGWRIAIPVAAVPVCVNVKGAASVEPVLVAEVSDGRRGPASVDSSWPTGVMPTGSSPLSQVETEVSLESFDVFTAWGAVGALAVWSVGVVVCAAPLALGLLSLRRLRLASEPVGDAETIEVAEAQAARLGVHRRFRLLRSPRRDIPMTWGVFWPVILLPGDSADWSRERLSVALAHELGHVKRLDCLTQFVARLVCAANWFNPLAWFALGRVRAEQELACDDLAIVGCVDAPVYAAHLLAIVSGRATLARESTVARAMASASRLERRLVGILDPHSDRRAVDRRRTGLVALAAAGLTVTLAVVNLETAVEACPVCTGEPALDDPPTKGDGQAEILEAVREASIKPPDEAALKIGAIKGILEALNDPYSKFVDAAQFAELERHLEGKLIGIGAQLETKDGQPCVVAPLPDSPAAKAGIKPGDILVEVEGKSTRGVALADVVQQIVGPSGTTVKIKVEHRDGKAEDLTLTRGVISFQTVSGFSVSADGRADFVLDPRHAIGYARVHQFSNGTSRNLKAAIESLKAKELKGMILDLRGCPGGLMTEAVETAKLFLAKGTVVTVKGREKFEMVYPADGAAVAGDMPLVVLINKQTASAAEIVAGALKDNDRALLVGDRSFGKGSVQTIIKLKDGGAIRLTTAYYELPLGENIDRAAGKDSWGVNPSDGYYVPARFPALAEEFARKRTVNGSKLGQDTVTPDWLERDQWDVVLAAGLKTMIARTTTGSFVKVGRPAAEITERERLLEANRKRRKAVLEELSRLDREMNELSLDHSEPCPK